MAQIVDSATVTRPQGGWQNLTLISSPVQTKQQSKKGARIQIVYEDITKQSEPAGNPGFQVFAVVEEELVPPAGQAPGVYSARAKHEPINNADTKGQQLMVLTTTPVFDPFPQQITSDSIVQNFQVELPEKYRVCILLQPIDSSKADLESLTVSVYVTETDA